MNSASLKISYLSLQICFSSWEICSQRQVSLQFHHLVGCYHLKSWKLSSAKTPNCERSNAPIFTIRVLGAILIRHVIANADVTYLLHDNGRETITTSNLTPTLLLTLAWCHSFTRRDPGTNHKPWVLQFCPTPRQIDWNEVRGSINEFSQRMHLLEYFHDFPTQIDLNSFHIESTWTPPQHRDTALDAFISAVEPYT